MIESHFWSAPSGNKIIMLLDAGLPCRAVSADMCKGEQSSPMPVHRTKQPHSSDPQSGGGGALASLFERGAILLYRVDKSQTLIPADTRGCAEARQWLFPGMAASGSIAGADLSF
jgi:glutathione S-transferase